MRGKACVGEGGAVVGLGGSRAHEGKDDALGRSQNEEW
jgi:hypothetical protein